jgi:hypothetical protein
MKMHKTCCKPFATSSKQKQTRIQLGGGQQTQGVQIDTQRMNARFEYTTRSLMRFRTTSDALLYASSYVHNHVYTSCKFAFVNTYVIHRCVVRTHNVNTHVIILDPHI